MIKIKNSEEIIAEYHLGGTTTRKLGLKYGYSFSAVASMIRLSNKGKDKLDLLKAVKLSIQEKEDLPSEVKALQDELRKVRTQVSLLEAMIAISDEQYGTNIRKKSGTRPS
jgi:predicted nuclease with TOPRIM domain